MARDFDQTQDMTDFVKIEDGRRRRAGPGAADQGVEVAFPIAEVLNQQELKESREEQINQLVSLVYALLALRS